ncbi:glucosaminidase domain-containing protein [Aestuariispira ectoiniformans]|uniref:glucosaminidase domain-containing protein n=1 Tax=Aestuariispira ectoiniformans TaxID=2775080 RepID=UPI00223A7B2A|nr:glucosaminidase domain-containing protein [Aestuariispira ectoiniformans]
MLFGQRNTGLVAGLLVLSSLMVAGCAKEWWRNAETDQCEMGPRLSAYHASIYENTGVLAQLSGLRGETVLDAYKKAGVDPANLWETTEIPRVYAASMPKDMADAATSEDRREVFVAVALPLILRVNEIIADRRAVVTAALDCVAQGRRLGGDLRSQIAWLDHHYGASGDLEELDRRVDGVPPSLALAQAVLDSGWGTSPAVQDKHALFGGRIALPKPKRSTQPVDLRGPAEKAQVQGGFEHLIHSVYAYMHALNTDPAFADFRRRRADLGGVDGEAIGTLLVSTLLPYADSGKEYASAVDEQIRYNDFQIFDTARLAVRDGKERFWIVEGD